MKILQAHHFDGNKQRLESLKDFYNLKEDHDVITLALRVLEYGMEYDSPIFFQTDSGDFYEIEIG